MDDIQAELLHWHYQLGHGPFWMLRAMALLNLLSMPILKVKFPKCATCYYVWSNGNRTLEIIQDTAKDQTYCYLPTRLLHSHQPNGIINSWICCTTKREINLKAICGYNRVCQLSLKNKFTHP